MKRAGWDIPSPPASMFAWAPCPNNIEEAGSMLFSKLLIEEAGVAVAPGVGFGEYGEGYVRVGLVENEHRIRQAARNVKKFLANSDEILGRAHNALAAAMSERKTWRVGVAGLGTVGAGLIDLPRRAPDFAPAGGRGDGHGRLGPFALAAAAVRHLGPALVRRSGGAGASPDVDVFVELIGGSDGPAKAAVEAALQRRQARGHRQQGADRRARRGTGGAGRGARACRCCSRPR